MTTTKPYHLAWMPSDPESVKADRWSGMSLTEVAKKHNISNADLLRKWLTKEGVTLTREQIQANTKRLSATRRVDPGADALIALIETNLPHTEIAKRLGISEASVRVYKRKHGLSAKQGQKALSSKPVEPQPAVPKQAIQPQAWAPADPEAVKAYRRDGKTLNEIIAKIKEQDASDAVTIEKLRKWLVKEGITLTQEQRNENTKRISAEKHAARASESPKISASSPSVTTKPNAQSRDPGREVLEELAKSGLSRLQIAAKVGVSDSTISTYLSKYGITTTGKQAGDPSRRKIREALATSPNKESAADKLGIARTALDRLIQRHSITGAGNAGRESSRRAMTEKARASIAETKANAAQQTKIVGTDTRALIDAAIAAGMKTKCPPAFCAETTRDPLSEEHRRKLIEYRKSRDAA